MSLSKKKLLNYNLQTEIESLFVSSTPKFIPKLINAGIKTLNDLIWIIPLRVTKVPPVGHFNQIKMQQFFRGHAFVLSIQHRPSNFGRGKVPLSNITLIVQDKNSEDTVQLKWFNCYPSMINKVKQLDSFYFQGVPTQFRQFTQFVNPEILELEEINQDQSDFLIKYPTVNKVSGNFIKKIFDKIPANFWDSAFTQETLPSHFMTLSTSFKTIHGKIDPQCYHPADYDRAKQSLIYYEFYQEQIKVLLRKKYQRSGLTAPIIKTEPAHLSHFLSIFPFTLTEDQKEAISEIKRDLNLSSPMMRLVQGDVGCGKTSVAVVASLMVLINKRQVAFMCPTETLARQQYETFRSLLTPLGYQCALLLGSTKSAEKKEILELLKNGKIHFIVGTHGLFQDKVSFKNLSLAIIDEQHKFGVNQRLRLLSKGSGCHCLIMTATPIPRSLSLTQYGDLNISVIKTMPAGRKGVKTRVVTPDLFENFLSFLNTRIQLKEQAYVVVPAIEDNDQIDIQNLENVYQRFSHFFPNYRIGRLHGKLPSEQKDQALAEFNQGKINILISTSVVEVGINVINASVMAIINPERFGLSSLHQLRGRVGRGDRPGFCFLVLDKLFGQEIMNRLRVIESSTDGFYIAEEDLKIRGEGNLFGMQQSGTVTDRKLANIVTDQDLLLQARNDLYQKVKTDPSFLGQYKERIKYEPQILSTV